MSLSVPRFEPTSSVLLRECYSLGHSGRLYWLYCDGSLEGWKKPENIAGQVSVL